ncbi:DUF4931 domain-containing protein [Streptococcus equinus]|uniref:DUF4931 domain-containing protein n=1 Tax=Streptococcus equinus TaxID=1335 RepID=UPI0008F44114|nr:DUF4931 domain-containing protein [Streptococcus equinus]SFC25278.1 Galactose-1-phosphate uridylyltransferase [Streptococcus equinus]SFR70108.1 Galactose-1-phosphate uridylyltransferase [Streptococcus equinus]
MKPLIFNPKIAKEKPDDSSDCPFCQVHQLTNILDENGGMIWLENKYRTLEETYQTIIIESDDHWGDISNYTYDYNRQLIRYAMDKFSSMQSQKTFQSVAMFKNYGPLSGGSLRHPHLQIVGFESQNVYEALKTENFEGLTVCEEDSYHAEINLSTEPIMGFCEFNIITSQNKLDYFADAIKNVVMYLLKDYFLGNCRSYNLFFFRSKAKVMCKVVPRFVVSPYYVGYKASQMNDMTRLVEIKQEFLKKFRSYYVKK